MCNGSVASAAPPISLPLGQLLTPTVPRAAPTATAGASAPPAAAAPRAPYLGQRLDVSA
jgi:hypothetical protein